MIRAFCILCFLILYSSFTDIHFIVPNTTPSLLADGEIYKISVDQTGVFKIDYNFLKNDLGVLNLENKDPRNIQLLSYGGGMLPELVAPQSEHGIQEVSIFIEGESDGRLDAKDYILFYSKGPDQSYWSEADQMMLIKKNLYARSANYFIKFGNKAGNRIKNVTNSIPIPATVINSYVKVQHLEDEKVNLLSGRTVTYGSGKEWYGDYFKTIRTKEYTSSFNFGNAIPGSPAKIKIAFAGRSDSYTQLLVQTNGLTNSLDIRNTNTGDVEDDIARESKGLFSFSIGNNNKISLDYPMVSNPSEGWLNYITLNSYHNLAVESKPFTFFNPDSRNQNHRFQISNFNENSVVWNVTNASDPQSLQVQNTNGKGSFDRNATNVVESFAVFDKSNLSSPTKGERIMNQDLLSNLNAEAIILFRKDPKNPGLDFTNAAKNLCNWRVLHSKVKTVVIPVDQVFNEFSAGQEDPTAIRNFARSQWLINPAFKYLTLFGDGTYDYLQHYPREVTENIIPVYETNESLNPIYAFPSDDYYGLLEVNEGGSDLEGDLDIAIGRISVRNADEANTLVDKIINYDKNIKTPGDWKNRIVFAADDEDSNQHLNQSERISSALDHIAPVYNVQKIYLDAFKQEIGAGGQIIPAATQALDKSIFLGTLIFNYLGHGGPKGLSQEGLLRLENVQSWSNEDRLPLVITATCSFAPYDDPNVLSAGEQLFRSPYGGAIALLTTVRNVYSSANEALTSSVFDHLFDRDKNNQVLTLGEIMRSAKNSIHGSDRSNARKFTLLGDPTQRLAIPSYKVATTEINHTKVTTTSIDTIKSLQLLEVKGQIVDSKNQKLNQFKGNVSITLYDKKSTVKTLGQDPDSYQTSFQMLNSILFKGNALVQEGEFQIKFVVPKDIDYNYGRGKISYFAVSNDSLEADGDYENIIIGGSQPLLQDNQGPTIQPFINDFSFKDGGQTHANPLLLISLFDENGINATGNSIGHDLVATLDGKKQYVLNSFYESKQGDYKFGQVTFPFNGLMTGPHTVHIKAWDVANNSGEADIHFIVVDPKEKPSILNLSVFPNPAGNTVHVNMVHSLGILNNARYDLYIYDVSGKLMYKTTDALTPSAVTSTLISLPGNMISGIYVLAVELWDAGKRLDVKSTKLLRIP